MTLAARNGVENACYTVADIIAHHIFNEESREKDSHNRINKEEPVGVSYVKAGSE